MKKICLLLLSCLALVSCGNSNFREKTYVCNEQPYNFKITLWSEDKCDVYEKNIKYFKVANYKIIESPKELTHLKIDNNDLYLLFKIRVDYHYWQDGELEIIEQNVGNLK